MSSLAYAIDFGTSNSGIAAVDHHGVARIASAFPASRESPGHSPFTQPSSLYFDSSKQRLSGWRALDAYQASIAQRNRQASARLISGLKNDLGDPAMHAATFFAHLGHALSLRDLVAKVLLDLRGVAEREFGDPPGSVTRLIMGHPVVFVGTRTSRSPERASTRNAAAKDLLVQAANAAGFEEVHLVDEASASSATNLAVAKRLLTVDFGGGTLDVSASQRTPDDRAPGDVVGIHGSATGGNDIDAVLFERLFAGRMGLLPHETLLPQRYANRMGTLDGYLHLLQDPDLRPEIAALSNDDPKLLEALSHVSNPSGAELYLALQAAKATCTPSNPAVIDYRVHLPGSTAIKTKVMLTAEDLAYAYSRLSQAIEETLDGCLDRANWGRADVERVALTGGSSLLTPFQQHLQTLLPNAVVTVPGNPFTSVLEGLCKHIPDEWI